MKRIQNFINGQFVDGSEQRVFEDISPLDSSLVAMVAEASRSDVDAAVKAAKSALTGAWGAMPMSLRCALLNDIADTIDRRFDDFVEAEIADTGKPYALASSVDIPRGSKNFRVFADLLAHSSNPIFSQETEDGAGALNYTVRRPKGVIAVISPWNLPMLLMTWKVAPALTCGNTVVVKPSEETPATASLLAEVIHEVGIPKGVFNVIHGFGANSAGEFLTQHKDIDAITFTGETRTGELIMRAAAVGHRDISSELGGKNPSLVFADCDLDKAIAGHIKSVFSNCGQVCLCTERVYVERPIYKEFVARLAEQAKQLKVGPAEDVTTQMGPLISTKHRDKVLQYYQLAREEGATVEAGGGIPKMADQFAGGAWIEPTIWTGLPETSRVVREEIFGPCCHIQPFDTEEKAIQMANNSPYGLASVIWSDNLSRVHRIAPQLETGITWVNTWNLRDLRTPFGGSKQSGIGREGGEYSLEFYSELKNICVKL